MNGCNSFQTGQTELMRIWPRPINVKASIFPVIRWDNYLSIYLEEFG